MSNIEKVENQRSMSLSNDSDENQVIDDKDNSNSEETNETENKTQSEDNLKLHDLTVQADYEGSIVPPLTHSNIQSVLQINEALIALLVDYQNKDWVDDPNFIIYQKRLQTNLTYLASVADHYLNPQNGDDTLKHKIPSVPSRGSRKLSPSSLNEVLGYTATSVKAKFSSTDPRLALFDKLAALRVEESMAYRETKPEFGTAKKNPEPSPYDLHVTYKVFDPPIHSSEAKTSTLLAPFRLPSEVELPPFK
ncbi:hypothetical protein K502DRAFT_346678 [Neoconidiobolus thromboides FSU 785]|nr:hypothetical protein K502DRAFT_346678 [Neoconidiobolus thromboides FSU 785]